MSATVVSSSTIEDGLRQMAPEHLRAALANFLPKGATADEQTRAIEAGLRSPAGQAMRDTMARWIVDEIVPVERLVPQAYQRLSRRRKTGRLRRQGVLAAFLSSNSM